MSGRETSKTSSNDNDLSHNILVKEEVGEERKECLILRDSLIMTCDFTTPHVIFQVSQVRFGPRKGGLRGFEVTEPR